MPCIIWLTGLSGAGKSTIATKLHHHFEDQKQPNFILDGDIVRTGLCSDLGFSAADRSENIRRISEVAKLFLQAGVIPIVAVISPYINDRQMARSLVPKGQFFEVYLDTPLSICEQRDPKGLYARARSGKLPGFTGIDSPYEPPITPELRLDTTHLSISECIDSIIAGLNKTTRPI